MCAGRAHPRHCVVPRRRSLRNKLNTAGLLARASASKDVVAVVSVVIILAVRAAGRTGTTATPTTQIAAAQNRHGEKQLARGSYSCLHAVAEPVATVHIVHVGPILRVVLVHAASTRPPVALVAAPCRHATTTATAAATTTATTATTALSSYTAATTAVQVVVFVFDVTVQLVEPAVQTVRVRQRKVRACTRAGVRATAGQPGVGAVHMPRVGVLGSHDERAAADSRVGEVRDARVARGRFSPTAAAEPVRPTQPVGFFARLTKRMRHIGECGAGSGRH
jgi:hypothetical protein